MKKRKFLLFAFVVMFMSISSVYAYTYSTISNLKAGSTKSSSQTYTTTENYYSLKTVKTGLSGSSASWTAYIVKPAAILFGQETILASAPMNLNTVMSDYSVSWNSKIGGGNKKLKFTGTSGTVSFTPILNGRN